MSKKFLKTLASAALAALACGCAKETATGDGEATVSFSIEVPGAPVTKGIGDGTTVKTLYYQAFDADGNAIEGLGVQTTPIENKTATVNFELIKEQTYNFVFWAQTDAEGYYTINATEGLKNITANYKGKSSNDENFDAFYAVKNITVSGPISETVELKRPFAQINIGSTGTIKTGEASRTIDFTGATSTVTVKGIPTVFSPLKTEPFGTAKNITFAEAAIPGGEITVNEKTYKQLAVNYVFAPVDGTVYDINATVKVEGKTVNVTVPSAPAKQNWKTNIVGDILTANGEIQVVVSEVFYGSQDFDLTNVKSAAELNAAIANGGKINIVGDITSTKTFSLAENKTTNISIENGVTVTGNLTGRESKVFSLFKSGINCTLSGEGTILGPTQESNSPGAAIELEDNSNVLTIDGNLTIKAREGKRIDSNGKVILDAGIIIRAGKVVVNNGHFISSRDVNGGDNPAILLFSPNSYRSELVINGGTFECESGNAKFLINIQDEYRDHASVKIYGGKFIGFNPADNDAEGPHTNFVADGYTVTASYDAATSRTVYTVVKATAVTDEESLKTGLSTTGAAVMLSGDTEITYVSVAKKATLNLNGKTLNCNADEALRSNSQSGNLSIVGPGTIKATAVLPNKQTSGISVRNGGTVNIFDGVTVDGGSGSKGNYAVRIIYGTVNIYGGYFHSGADANGGSSEVIYLEGAHQASSKANLNIYGGVFECDGDAKLLINMQDTNRSKCTAKIYGGTFVGFNPADNTAEGTGTNFVADGYKSVETTYNGKQAWKVVKE